MNSSNDDDDDGPKDKSGSSRSIAAPAATVYSCTTDRHLTYVYIYITTPDQHHTRDLWWVDGGGSGVDRGRGGGGARVRER